jgi:hypothetical protein
VGDEKCQRASRVGTSEKGAHPGLHAAVLAAGGGETAQLAVLVHGVDDPVDTRVLYVQTSSLALEGACVYLYEGTGCCSCRCSATSCAIGPMGRTGQGRRELTLRMALCMGSIITISKYL